MSGAISNPEAYRAGLYVRLSREDERGEDPSGSITNQIALLREFAEANFLNIVDIYADDGFSGTNFDRPAFQRMIRDIEAKRINMVLTKDLSRLGRDYIMVGYYMERYFPEQRVRYLSLLDGIDTGIESGANDITPFRAIMNDMYAKDISRKIKAVKHEKQRRGQFIGGKPVYGYQMHPTEKNTIIVDESAAAVVRRIFALALDGRSCRSIAEKLNEAKIPPPAVYCGRSTGGKWSGERISELLRNETYLGSMVQGRSAKLSYKSKKCVKLPPERWVIVPQTHAPVVDRDSFHQVQRLLDCRRHTRCRSYDYLLKGLIFCHECGAPLGVINRKTAAGEDSLYFICRGYQRSTASCSCHCVKVSAVTEAVSRKIRALCDCLPLSPKLLPLAAKSMTVQNARSPGGNGAASHRAQICGLTKKLDRIYADRLNGLLEESDFRRIYESIKAERAALESQQALLEHQMPPAETAEALVKRFLEGVGDNRALLVSLLARIELTAQRQLILHFRFRAPEAFFRGEALTLAPAEGIAD